MRRLAWILAGCSDPDMILETTTDGGSWTVALSEAPAEAGPQTLQLQLEPADGQLTSAVVSMPDMGHASEAGIEDQGSGRFALAVDLEMSGWWLLDGTVTDGGAEESFRLELEVP